MLKTWVQNFTDTEIILLGMFLFMTVFLSVFFITYHKGRKSFFDKMQNLPFEETQP